MWILALQISSGNLIFGFLPESAAILVFGVALVASTVAVRRFFKKHDAGLTKEENKATHKR